MNNEEKYKQLYIVLKKELDCTRNESFINKSNFEYQKKQSEFYKKKYEEVAAELNSIKSKKVYRIFERILGD